MTPCQFFIPPSTDFIDMGMCQLTLGVKLIQANGADIEEGLNIGVVNNVGHSFKRFDVKLNDTSVGEPTDLYHYVRLQFEKFHPRSERQLPSDRRVVHGRGHRRQDEQLHHRGHQCPLGCDRPAYNKGFDERTRLFYTHYTSDGTGVSPFDIKQASREVHFTIQPAVDVFQSGRSLGPGVSIVIQIDFNDPQFVLMAAAGASARFKITSALFRHVKINPSVHLEIEDKQYKQQQTVVYPIRTSKSIRRTMEMGKSVFSFTDLPTIGARPIDNWFC
ncbi:hypothetical protein QZH41_001028 [Actinostola sp. cb2023]|nr:hypothetical protein QZH41_001028 [Actinostola sp. cb2023]